MGLFSGLKSALGGILSGAKKHFKQILTTVGKVMSNKYVRGALLVATVVCPVLGAATSAFSATSAAGGSFMASLGNAGLAAAKMVGSLVVKAVTTPLKALANGGANVAGMFNANGLASTLQNAATTIGNTSTSIFGNIPTDSMSQIMGKMGIGDGASGATDSSGVAGATDAAKSATPTLDSAADQLDKAGNVQLGSGDALDAARNYDPTKINLSGALQTTGDAAAKIAATPTPPTGLLGKTLDFMNKNPEATKLVGTAVASALSPNEADLARAQWQAKVDAENQLNQKNAAAWNSFDSGIAGQQGSYQQPQAQPSQVPDFRSRAQTARDFINAGYQSPIAAVSPTASLLNRALPQSQY